MTQIRKTFPSLLPYEVVNVNEVRLVGYEMVLQGELVVEKRTIARWNGSPEGGNPLIEIGTKDKAMLIEWAKQNWPFPEEDQHAINSYSSFGDEYFFAAFLNSFYHDQIRRIQFKKCVEKGNLAIQYWSPAGLQLHPSLNQRQIHVFDCQYTAQAVSAVSQLMDRKGMDYVLVNETMGQPLLQRQDPVSLKPLPATSKTKALVSV